MPDLDEIPALSLEREALWKRLGDASFLTDDEKRAAVGYEPIPAASLTTLLAKFDPNQPRVPGGSPGGGQWTSGGYGVGNERVLSDENPDELVPGAQYAQNENLPIEQALNKHILDDHVDKTDEELIARIRRETLRGVFVTTGRDRNGAFDSPEAARKFHSSYD